MEITRVAFDVSDTRWSIMRNPLDYFCDDYPSVVFNQSAGKIEDISE